MQQLEGILSGDTPGARVFHIGAFAGPRIAGQPVSWTTLNEPGPFTLAVPGGTWYIHAVGGPVDTLGFLSGTTWGSHGGIYGFGLPAVAGVPLKIRMSPLWRDLTHLPLHRQPVLTDDQWQAIHRGVEALRADLSSPVVGGLDRSAGLTRTRLAALFKRGTGLTMEEYRTRLRLEVAKALLVETDWEVLRVAVEVGYSTAAQLGRGFQRYLGVAPGEFRRRAWAVQQGEAPQVQPALLDRFLPALLRHGATVRGEILYGGTGRDGVIYVGLFPRPVPDTYPVAWCAIPGPGPFTLRRSPPGDWYLLAAYCRRRMRYPGDLHTAFAFGAYGEPPVPLTLRDRDEAAGLSIELTDGDAAAAFGRPWTQLFLPDGR